MTPPSVQTWVSGLAVSQYVLVREIARGGMGEIWLARQAGGSGFERLVVLKRVIAGLGADGDAMTMFLDEARIASQLQHPNIVQVFELGREAGAVFLVMEYLAGQTLSKLTRRMVEAGGRVPEALAASIASAVARGLGYAHRRADLEGRKLDIVHRDVSPQNIFLTYDGEVKLLDFGIARAVGRMGKTITGTIKGKVAYMSPEQAAGGAMPVTGAADVYALGIILFELVTGTRLYQTKDELAILRRLALLAPPPAPSTRAAVDADLETLILRALEPEAGNRFADGQDFFEALEAWRRAHRTLPGELSLQEAMATHFKQEADELGEFHRQAGRTPVTGSKPKPDQPTVSRALKATPAPAPTSEPTRSDRAVKVAPVSQPSPLAKTLFLGPAAAAPKKFPARAAAAAAAVVVLGGAGLTVWLARAPGRVEEPSPIAAAPLVAAAAAPAPAILAPPARPEAPGATEASPPPALSAPAKGETAHRIAAKGGLLTLDTVPWTRVYLGKRALGDTPLVEIPLAAGTHRLRLENTAEKVDTIIEVVIKPRETTVKKLAF